MINARTPNQVRAIAALQFIAGFVVGCVFLLILSPLGVRRLLRELVTRTRRVLKPAALFVNSCCYQESEHEVSRLELAREDAVQKMRHERERQVRLQQRRNEIARW